MHFSTLYQTSWKINPSPHYSAKRPPPPHRHTKGLLFITRTAIKHFFSASTAPGIQSNTILSHLQLVLLLVRGLRGKDAEDVSDAAGNEKAYILAGVFHVEVRGKVQSQPCELLIVILAHLLERSCQQLQSKTTPQTTFTQACISQPSVHS